MIPPRCLIVVSDRRASFQADFAAQGNGFRRNLRFRAHRASTIAARHDAGTVMHEWGRRFALKDQRPLSRN